MTKEVYRINMTPHQDIVEAKIQRQGWGYKCHNCGRKWMYSLALYGNKEHKIQWKEDDPKPSCGFAVYYTVEESS